MSFIIYKAKYKEEEREERKEEAQEKEEDEKKKYIRYSVPGPVLDVCTFILTSTTPHGKYYYPHLTEEKPAVQRA